MSKIIDGEMFAPGPKQFKASHKPKKVNLERFLTIDEMFSLKLNEHRLIDYFIMMKPHRSKIGDGEWNQTIKYSHSELKKYISNANVFYAALNRLEELDIIKPIPDQPAMYRMNPLCISNLTLEQAREMGIVKKNSFNSR